MCEKRAQNALKILLKEKVANFLPLIGFSMCWFCMGFLFELTDVKFLVQVGYGFVLSVLMLCVYAIIYSRLCFVNKFLGIAAFNHQ